MRGGASVIAVCCWRCGASKRCRSPTRSRRFVQYWVYRYRDHGLAGLTDRPRSGQPTRLPRAAEDRLRARLDAQPHPATSVCALRGADVVRVLQEEFGVTYSLPGAYDLLHRLGYSYLRPRPQQRAGRPIESGFTTG
jgi:transposase